MLPKTRKHLGWAIFVGTPPLSGAIARHFCVLITADTPQALSILYGAIAFVFAVIGFFFLAARFSGLIGFMNCWWKEVIDPLTTPRKSTRRRR